MIWKVFFSTFAMVFLAELGDKTQLATMLLATQNREPLSTFLGAASALVCASMVAVTLGGVLVRYCPTEYLQIGAGIAFVVIGLLL
ncbi:MAG: TMEM165/GDT1 family protein, partial [Bacillota bacterium]